MARQPDPSPRRPCMIATCCSKQHAVQIHQPPSWFHMVLTPSPKHHPSHGVVLPSLSKQESVNEHRGRVRRGEQTHVQQRSEIEETCWQTIRQDTKSVHAKVVLADVPTTAPTPSAANAAVAHGHRSDRGAAATGSVLCAHKHPIRAMMHASRTTDHGSRLPNILDEQLGGGLF